MRASQNGHKDTATALLAAGADVHVKNNVSAVVSVYDEGWDCVHVCGGVRVFVVCHLYVIINI